MAEDAVADGNERDPHFRKPVRDVVELRAGVHGDRGHLQQGIVGARTHFFSSTPSMFGTTMWNSMRRLFWRPSSMSRMPSPSRSDGQPFFFGSGSFTPGTSGHASSAS